MCVCVFFLLAFTAWIVCPFVSVSLPHSQHTCTLVYLLAVRFPSDTIYGCQSTHKTRTVCAAYMFDCCSPTVFIRWTSGKPATEKCVATGAQRKRYIGRINGWNDVTKHRRRRHGRVVTDIKCGSKKSNSMGKATANNFQRHLIAPTACDLPWNAFSLVYLFMVFVAAMWQIKCEQHTHTHTRNTERD